MKFRLQHPGDLSPTLHITMQRFKIGNLGSAIDLIPMTQHPRVFVSTFAFALHIYDLHKEISKKNQERNTQV